MTYLYVTTDSYELAHFAEPNISSEYHLDSNPEKFSHTYHDLDFVTGLRVMERLGTDFNPMASVSFREGFPKGKIDEIASILANDRLLVAVESDGQVLEYRFNPAKRVDKLFCNCKKISK